MKNTFLFLFLLFSSTIIAQHISGIKIINHHYFNNLPSASGVELYDSSLYLVADDLPWLIQMNYEGDVINKYPVSGITTIENGRTPKSIKADFESMAFVKINQKDYFLIFSSGSKKVKRDTVSLFSLESKTVVAQKNLRSWFETIKNKSGMAATDEINIEGSAVVNGKIYLTPITDENNIMIAKKQEGVALIKVDKLWNYRVLTVCDNDDGTSDIWQFEFKLK